MGDIVLPHARLFGVPAGRVLVSSMMALALSGCILDTLRDGYVIDDAYTSRNEPRNTGASTPPPLNLDCFVFETSLPSGKSIADGGDCPAKTLTIPSAYREVLEKQKIAFEGSAAPIPKEADTNKDKNAAPKSDGDAAKKTSDASKTSDAFNKEIAQRYRNLLLDALEERSDKICETHIAYIMSNSAVVDFATSFPATLLSGISAAVSGSTATSLSLASTGIGGLGTAARANFYQQTLAPAVARKIRELRVEGLKDLKSHRNDLITIYSVQQMLKDFSQYHITCSFHRGIEALANGEREQPPTAAALLAEIKRLSDENQDLETNKLKDKTNADISASPILQQAKQVWDTNNLWINELKIKLRTLPAGVVAAQQKANDAVKTEESKQNGAPGDSSAADAAKDDKEKPVAKVDPKAGAKP